MILQATNLEASAFNESFVTSLKDFERQITQTASNMTGQQILDILQNLEASAKILFIDEDPFFSDLILDRMEEQER